MGSDASKWEDGTAPLPSFFERSETYLPGPRVAMRSESVSDIGAALFGVTRSYACMSPGPKRGGAGARSHAQRNAEVSKLGAVSE